MVDIFHVVIKSLLILTGQRYIYERSKVGKPSPFLSKPFSICQHDFPFLSPSISIFYQFWKTSIFSLSFPSSSPVESTSTSSAATTWTRINSNIGIPEFATSMCSLTSTSSPIHFAIFDMFPLYYTCFLLTPYFYFVFPN